MSKSKHIYFERDLITSKAYLSLTGKSAQVLGILFCKRQFSKVRRKGKHNYVIRNNGQIIFTGKEAAEKYGISKYQFSRALDQLVSLGFINVDPEPFNTKHCNLFTLIENWKYYGTSEFKPGHRVKLKPINRFKAGKDNPVHKRWRKKGNTSV